MNNSTWCYNKDSFLIDYEHTIFSNSINEDNQVVNDIVIVTAVLCVIFDKGTQSVSMTQVYFLHDRKIKWGGQVKITLINE